MILSIEELKKFVTTEEPDEMLEARLQAVEVGIRKYTNNNFQKRAYRRTADIVGGLLFAEALIPFDVGDTIQISASKYNEGLYTIKEVDSEWFSVNESVLDEKDVMVTKVEYPADVKMAVVEIIKWQLKNEAANSGDTSHREIQSETISRHSVTYVTDATETDLDFALGVPRKYTAFLQHYKKARF